MGNASANTGRFSTIVPQGDGITTVFGGGGKKQTGPIQRELVYYTRAGTLPPPPCAGATARRSFQQDTCLISAATHAIRAPPTALIRYENAAGPIANITYGELATWRPPRASTARQFLRRTATATQTQPRGTALGLPNCKLRTTPLRF